MATWESPETNRLRYFLSFVYFFDVIWCSTAEELDHWRRCVRCLEKKALSCVLPSIIAGPDLTPQHVREQGQGRRHRPMLSSLLFLGTWPVVLTLLERRGRLPQHMYLDYSFTNLLGTVLVALIFAQLGGTKHSMPNFFTQFSQQDNWPSVLFAMAGSVVHSVRNLTTQTSVEMVACIGIEAISRLLFFNVSNSMTSEATQALWRHIYK
ncbi:Ureide permease 2 [Zea mays]|uniref:Ureide permease 2 n=1 Tax=Zea mays TaxID=4577 RepID=A0A3L6EQ46_MAIZE|nr:Ureide permease 2 [Zea mays]